MMKGEPKERCQLTIIVRTYNSAHFIVNALKSITIQKVDWNEVETVVVDDGSDDNTKLLIDAFLKKHPFLSINFIAAGHGGPIKALNTGVKAARGELIILLDADDEFVPGDILSLMAETLAGNKTANFVYGDYYEKDMQTGKTAYVSVKNNIFQTVAGGIMFRTAVVREVNLYDESLFFPEYDLLIKIQQKYRGMYIPKPVFIYKRHKGSITSNKEGVALGKKQLFEKYGEIPQLRDY